jgi:hydroxymethylpyrimidine kinase/phosphomethylpyrimidine kinase
MFDTPEAFGSPDARMNVASMGPPVVLTITGSDPTGCRGLQADLSSFAAHHAHGACVTTATGGSTGIFALPATVVAGQLTAALAVMPPVAVKIGMLATAEIAAVVGARARAGDLPNLVLDPILETTGPYRRGLVAAIQRLIPYATCVTPSVEEASELVGWPIGGTADMAGAAAQLAATGVRYVVITGGQLGGDESVDAVWGDGGVRFLHAPRVPETVARGTGCSFSAAIAARLAQGHRIDDAVTGAKEFVSRALDGARGWHVGVDTGPLDHFGFALAVSSPRRVA